MTFSFTFVSVSDNQKCLFGQMNIVNECNPDLAAFSVDCR